MNKLKLAFILLITLTFTSCYTPSPLYGTWSDNNGNSIVFMPDGTFTSKIIANTDESAINYEGSYTVIDNAIVFNVISEESSYTRNTEWDIRGAILYLSWTVNNETKNLALYHTGR